MHKTCHRIRNKGLLNGNQFLYAAEGFMPMTGCAFFREYCRLAGEGWDLRARSSEDTGKAGTHIS